MADHSKPTTTSTYVNFVSELDGRLDDISLGLDPATTSPTNLATNAIRWTSASNKWQKYNGTTWADLSSAYSININGTVGATTPASGAFTTLSATGNVTLGDASGDTVTINGTVGAGVVISGSTATDALRITQTGAGNALVVEDSTNPDSTPFVVDTSGNLLIGSSTSYDTVALTTTIAPHVQVHGVNIATSSLGQYAWNTNPYYTFNKSNGAIGTYTATVAADFIGAIQFNATDGTSFVRSSQIRGTVDSATSTGIVPGRLTFLTSDSTGTLTERMRIDSAGNVSIGGSGTSVQASLRINKNITGGTGAYGLLNNGVVQSDVTTTALGYYSNLSLAASVSTTSVAQFYASAASGGAGSSITNQYGFLADSTLGTAGAATITAAFGFYGNIASGTGRWNFFSAGTASNAFLGKTAIGSISSPAVTLAVTGTDAILVPVGTTAQRPTGATGYIRYNTSTSSFEGHNGTAWGNIGGGATGGGTDTVFYLNSQSVSTTYSIPSGQNASCVGPITVSSGATVTVPSGSRWVVL